MNKMIRGGVRFGPATGVRSDPAQIAVLEARLRLAEEVCEAAEEMVISYRDHTIGRMQRVREALARWREAKR
jgi:hypothetical protein